MRSILKFAVIPGLAIMGASCSSAVAAENPSAQLDDLPLVAVSAELGDCLPEVKTIKDPYWVPDEETAKLTGYGYVDQMLAGIPAIPELPSSCNSQLERIQKVSIANAQSTTGDSFRALNEKWANCMAEAGYEGMSSVSDRHGLMWDKTTSKEALTIDAYQSRLQAAKSYEIDLAMADRSCFESEIAANAGKLLVEQKQLLEELPSEVMQQLKQ